MPANRLASEKSPYLLQHAHNPVDWRPWGEEAFAEARRQDKPIFLSVGYSTCHWCHVMERESFESEEIAAILNRYFVPIKVDREERPDVDRIYMLFVQATSGSGGWPMSVWLTPELQPFFGGTYFPPDNRYGRPGFKTVLQYLADKWQTERARIVESATQVVGQLEQMSTAAEGGEALDGAVLDSAYNQVRRTFDPRRGGFGGAPKFPRPVLYNFLLRYYAYRHSDDARDMALLTLHEMAKGGMYDQLGGGFHRYSVDARWFVPHFEKMLYDQAQLLASYCEAFQIDRAPQFEQVARGIAEYVLRDLTHPDGGFYSAEDADSVIDPANPKEKGEGAFYIWSAAELKAALGERRAAVFAYRYGVEDEGNVEEDPHREFTGKNILYQAHTIDETAIHSGLTPADVRSELDAAHAILLNLRGRRFRPHLDDKVLTAWNGLMISAFAKAANALNEPRYLAAAQRAVRFINAAMVNAGSGELLRRFREGEAAIPGFLDDYAFYIQALLDLYEADFDAAHLRQAATLADAMLDRFEDRERGGFFSTAAGDPSLVLRMKDDYDGAEPSGNSVAALDLLRLAHLTSNERYSRAAERTLASFSAGLRNQPMAAPQMLVALLFHLMPVREIVLVGDPGRFLPILRRRFLPDAVTLNLSDAPARAALSGWQPALREMTELQDEPTAYVCRNFACQLPTSDPAQFEQLLK